jgi:hypothetical protein
MNATTFGMKCVRRVSTALLISSGLSLTGCGGGSGGNSSNSTSSDSRYLVAAVENFDTSTPTLRPYQLQLVDPLTGKAWLIDDVTRTARIDEGQIGTDDIIRNILPHHLLYVRNGALQKISMVVADTAPHAVTLISSGVCWVSSERNDYANPERSLISTAGPGADGQCGTSDDTNQLIQFGIDGNIEVLAKGIQQSFWVLPETSSIRSAMTWLTSHRDQAGNLSVARLDSRDPAIMSIDFQTLPDAPFQIIGSSHTRTILQGKSGLWMFNPWAGTPQSVMQRLGGLAISPTSAAYSDYWFSIGWHGAALYLLHERYDLSGNTSTWELYSVQSLDGSSQLLTQGSGTASPSIGESAILLTQRNDDRSIKIFLLNFDGQPGPTLLTTTDLSMSARWLSGNKLLIENKTTTAPTLSIYDATGQQLFFLTNAINMGSRLTVNTREPGLHQNEPQLIYMTEVSDTQPRYGTGLWMLDLASGQKRHLGQIPDPAIGGSGNLFAFANGTAGAAGFLTIMRDTTSVDPMTGAYAGRVETLGNYVFDSRQADSLRLVQPH